MPYLHLRISDGVTVEQQRQLIDVIMSNTASILGKKLALTVITVDVIPQSQWVIGGQVLSDDSVSFYLDIKITEGTNTKQEKSYYVHNTFEKIANILSDISPVSYIVIDSIPADSWGYAGQTQEFRYIQSNQHIKDKL